MNHKRRRPKHQRAGCLFCKPHKDERAPKKPRSKRDRAILEEFDRLSARLVKLFTPTR